MSNETEQLDPEETLRSIFQILHEKPAKYRTFGVYWWPIKALLKARYTKDQLYLLGDYEDLETAELVPNNVGLHALLEAAIDEHQKNSFSGMGSNQVESPDGDIVVIYDEDAGL